MPLQLPLGHSQWIEICARYNGVMYHGGSTASAESNQQCSEKFVVNRRDGNAGNYEAHHVKPLQWGGMNLGSNGMFLPPQDHLRFSKWWNRFDL